MEGSTSGWPRAAARPGHRIYRIKNGWPVAGVAAIAHPGGSNWDACFLQRRRAESLRDLEAEGEE
jgi:hypothetical protein